MKGVYPFNYSKLEDFEEVMAVLIKDGTHDAYTDKWTLTFLPFMKKLEQQAGQAESEGDYQQASALYLRAASLGMISRFPMLNSATKRNAWEFQKRLYIKGTSYWPSPIENVIIPHTHASSPDGDGSSIQMFVRLPAGISPSKPAPVLLYITGLDGYRTDCMPQATEFIIAQGIAIVSVDIPGCGDSPAAPNDPLSPDRFFDTVLEWIEAQTHFDKARIGAWGTSTGGYYAMRIAHTHATRLKMVIAQGGASHLAFSKEWLDQADGGEYAFSITPALQIKFGYKTIQEMKEDAQRRFSLIDAGMFLKPCTRLILLNGTKDSIFPVEDSMLPLNYGRVKEARFFPGLPHMGFPDVFPVLLGLIKEL